MELFHFVTKIFRYPLQEYQFPFHRRANGESLSRGLFQIIASIRYDWPTGRLVFFTFCRLLIVPLMMICATPRDDPILKEEGWSMMLSGILGITNGYFGSVPMILAPAKVPEGQKELTGNWTIV